MKFDLSRHRPLAVLFAAGTALLAYSYAPSIAAADDKGSSEVSRHAVHHSKHMDDRFDRLRDELALTDAQKPLWDRFIEVSRADRASMPEKMRRDSAQTAPERMLQMQSAMQDRANAMQKVADALRPLYDSLNAEQRTKLDRYLGAGMDGRHQGGPMHHSYKNRS